jgi:putative redox protein
MNIFVNSNYRKNISMIYKLENPIYGSIGTTKYACTIQWSNGTFISDELPSSGGRGAGPDFYTLLLSSVASCILITLRMYIDRKGWYISNIAVNVNMYQTKNEEKITTVIDTDVKFLQPVKDEHRHRLTEIAQACPISKILEGEIKLRTFTYNDSESEKQIKYPNDEITVVWKPDVCKHSGRCVTQLPGVFNTQAKPWINTKGATTEVIINQVQKCPTGALSFYRNENNIEQKS